MQTHGIEKDSTGRYLIISAVITALLMYLLFFSRFAEKTPAEQHLVKVHLPDFAAYTDVKERKQAFFNYLRPLIQQVNQEVERDRQQLLELFSAFEHKGSLSQRQWQQVFRLAQKYRVDEALIKPEPALFEELLLRVDILPEALVLAQAANESSWGRSRFATEGNNLFGQWCFSQGCGLIPTGRPEGATYEVAVFDTPLDSIRSYMMNLNSFHAYQQLREIRRQLRERGEAVTGKALAEGLINYSTRREEYVKEIQAMIDHNDLE
jgi:Bax protein